MSSYREFHQRSVADTSPSPRCSPSFAAYGYRLKLKHEETGKEVGTNEKGARCIVPPLPPGSMTTVWGDDARYVSTCYKSFADEMVYTTFDWATKDEDGYYFVLGRTDDVINVAGHRLGTREIEEAVQANPAVAEVAVVGVADAVKGQIPIAFAVLPKIRSGKLLCCSIQALCEWRDPAETIAKSH